MTPPVQDGVPADTRSKRAAFALRPNIATAPVGLPGVLLRPSDGENSLQVYRRAVDTRGLKNEHD